MSGLDRTCGGLRILYCYCVGDFCVCAYHGEVECYGCEDCDPDEDDFDDDMDGDAESALASYYGPNE